MTLQKQFVLPSLACYWALIGCRCCCQFPLRQSKQITTIKPARKARQTAKAKRPAFWVLLTRIMSERVKTKHAAC